MPSVIERAFPASPSTGRTGAALAAPWLFTGEDNLRLVIINSQPGVVVTLAGRRLGPADLSPQAFVYTATPSATRTPNTFDVVFGDGFLLNCSLVVSSGNPLIGQTYAMLQVIRGFTGSKIVLGALLGGYITALQSIGYPGSPILSSTEGEPAVRRVTGTQPALGGELSETVPQGARWEIISFCAALTASAVVANRWATLSWTSGGVKAGGAMMQSFVVASSTRTVTWAPGQVAQTGIINPDHSVALPARLILLQNAALSTLTQNLDAGDQWGTPTYLVREWLEAS